MVGTSVAQKEEPFKIEPWDEYNQETVANVHPNDWVNPDPASRYNLVVVGAGTAGLVSALGSVGLGAKVALIEKDMMGGDCLNVGCVPSKALIRASRVAAEVRSADTYGVNVPDGVSVDFSKVMERMRRLRAGISENDSAHRLQGEGVDVFIGKGTFTGPDTIAVDDKTLRFSNAVIATGARAAAPPIAGLKEAGYLTNETVFSLTELPSRLVVIGAGPIGCELSQAFARFGSEVHLLEAGDQILIREDSDAAERVGAALVRDGVKIVAGCKIRAVSKHGADKLVELECGGERRVIATDEILVGVGRAPNVEGLGLEAAGVKFDPRKGVVVDDRLRTSNPKIFAAGDCCFQYKFTHTADALARIVIQNALFGLPFMKKKASALTIPWCTYTDPEIAHVGYYEKDARDRGFDVETINVELSDVDRAILDGQTAGFLKLHIDKRTSRILGGTLVAEHAGEMIGELALAITTRLKIGAIAETIHPYPTQGEVFKRAADAWNRKRLTPGVKNLFTRFFKLFT